MKSVITPVKKRNEYFIFTKFSQGRFLQQECYLKFFFQIVQKKFLFE